MELQSLGYRAKSHHKFISCDCTRHAEYSYLQEEEPLQDVQEEAGPAGGCRLEEVLPESCPDDLCTGLLRKYAKSARAGLC